MDACHLLHSKFWNIVIVQVMWRSTHITCVLRSLFMWKGVYLSCSAEDPCYFKPLANWVRFQCSLLDRPLQAGSWLHFYLQFTQPLFPDSSIRSEALHLSSMYWPCSLMHTRARTHRGAWPPLRLPFCPTISSFTSLTSPLSTLPFISFNSPMRCQSRRRWRGWAGPEDIPLSFEQPFASVSAEMEGSWEKSMHAQKRKMGVKETAAKENERNVSTYLLNETEKWHQVTPV